MITDDQTNKIYFSPFLETECPKLWASIHQELTKRNIRHGLLNFPRYIWCRDYMPIQIAENGFVAYRFEPDYLVKNQRRYRQFLMCDGYEIASKLTYPMTGMNLILDGGNVVKCGDTIVMTEKVFYENREKNRMEVERILRDTLKSDILFLPWDREEIFGHSDGIVHDAGEGRVLMTNYEDFDRNIAHQIEKCLEKKFDVIHLQYKTKRMHKRSWAYINFLQTEKLVMVPQLEAEEDEQALEQISAVFPDSEVIGIPALETVRKGGALNCISWNVKDNGAIPVELYRYLHDVKRMFYQYKNEYFSEDVFTPIHRFLEHKTDLPSIAEIDALTKWLKDKKSEMKHLPRHIQCGTSLNNTEDDLLVHQFQMWQLILSVLWPFVNCLRENLKNLPFEYVR